VVGTFVRTVAFPDLHTGWARAVERLVWARHLCAGVDVVLATGGPFSAFVAGAAVAERHKLPLILDYQDLWTDSPAYPGGRLHRKRARGLERALLENARAVTAVGVGVLERLRQNYGRAVAGKPLKVVSLGADTEAAEEARRAARASSPVVGESAGIVVGYFGTLYGTRAARALATYAQELHRLCGPVTVLFAGRDYTGAVATEFRDHAQEVRFVALGVVDWPSAIDIMNRCDVLTVLLSQAYREELTNKAYDYLCARRLVVAFGSPDGDLATLLNELETGAVFGYENAEAAARWTAKRLSARVTPGPLPEHVSARSSCRHLADVLSSVVGLERLERRPAAPNSGG